MKAASDDFFPSFHCQSQNFRLSLYKNNDAFMDLVRFTCLSLRRNSFGPFLLLFCCPFPVCITPEIPWEWPHLPRSVDVSMGKLQCCPKHSYTLPNPLKSMGFDCAIWMDQWVGVVEICIWEILRVSHNTMMLLPGTKLEVTSRHCTMSLPPCSFLLLLHQIAIGSPESGEGSHLP